MKINDELQQTIKQFKLFQASGKSSHYPNHLKIDAMSLMERCSLNLLSKQLGVSRVTLKKWKSANEEAGGVGKARPQFARLEVNETEPAVIKRTLRLPDLFEMEVLTVSLPLGVSLQLPKQSIKQTVHFLCTLVKELNSCSI